MKIQYIANDGKIFDNEIDCREYESKKQVDEFVNKRELIFLSRSGEVLFGEIDDCAERANYIFVNSDAALQALWGENECQREIRPHEKGYWYYDYEYETWRSMKTQVEILENELAELNEIYDRFGRLIGKPHD